MMRALGIGVLVVLSSACKHGPGAVDGRDASSVTASAAADDEGIVLTLHGPAGARYEGAGKTAVADARGDALLVVERKERTSATLVVTVRADAQSSTLSVALPEIATPRVIVTATPAGPHDESYAIDAACSGACTGTATFSNGQGGVHVAGTTGCSFRSDGTAIAFDQAPTRDPATGALKRISKVAPVSVVDAVRAGKLPDVLTSDATTTATFSCPDRPTEDVKLTFGAGAAVTAVWSRYQFVGQLDGVTGRVEVKRALEGRDRASALVTVESDGHMSGLDLPHDLVRFYGAPKATDEVQLVGKLTEARHPKRDTCTISALTFEVERSDLVLDAYDGTDQKLGSTRIAAPPLDCAALATEAPVRVYVGAGYDVRISRPGAAQIEAAMRKWMH
ncbi:hypothetical protein BH09MYX1_BH09MYX1_61190 [soil metagenome]